MSTRPNLKIEMPARKSSEFRRPSQPIRSPRFTEDFDAPFSEALVNDPQTTTPQLSESGCYSSYSAQSRPSYDFSARRVSPTSTVRTLSFPAQSPTEQWPQETRHRSNINDRVKEWARRSLIIGRSRPNSSYDIAERASATSKSAAGSDDGLSDRGSS